MKKPQPLHTETVCSVCGLDWDRHDKASIAECVELLKADLAREKLRTSPPPQIIPYPYPQPYPIRPYTPGPWINRPMWMNDPPGTFGGNSTKPMYTSNSGGIYQ